ncbi:MAG: hypothetical protein RI897_3380 [Verrucomicrobiota bacterium]|jgi:hypothetical protein
MRRSILVLAIAALSFGVSAADVTGTWEAEFDTQIGGERHESKLTEGQMEGDTVEFLELLSFQGAAVRISQGVHRYLKDSDVPHIWHVDGNAHDATHWRNSLYPFGQLLFSPLILNARASTGPITVDPSHEVPFE